MTRRAASLTGSLMARKGTAGPSRLELEEAERKDNRPPPPRLVSPAPAAAKQTGAKAGPAARAKTSSAPAGDKRRFTLRLDEDQHMRMRLASVHLHMSAQQMVMKALDRYLADTVPHIRGGDCACIESSTGGCASEPDGAKGKT